MFVSVVRCDKTVNKLPFSFNQPVIKADENHAYFKKMLNSISKIHDSQPSI